VLHTQAVRLVPFAFEKSDAKEKYGGENVFSAMMGRPSLRWGATLLCAGLVRTHATYLFTRYT
jgi:hypothetical protein